MPYTTNPHLPKVRRDTVLLVRKGWSIRKAARYVGVNPGTVSRWVKKAPDDGRLVIATRSCRPKTSPRALPRSIIKAIIRQRQGHRRCGQVIHQELLRQGVRVSLSSVQRTLDRCRLLKKRSLWKRPHDATPRPEVMYAGALLQADTVHLLGPEGNRIYIYTLIDLFSRWAYAEAVERISAQTSVEFIRRARVKASFTFEMIQTDHGPEFSSWFTHTLWRMNMGHRHSRVRQSNDNAHIERFNRTIQEECLDRTTHTLKDFRKALTRYLPYYNTERIHMGINYRTPLEVLRSY